MIPQETDPDWPVSVQESAAEVWVQGAEAVACCRAWELSAAVRAQGLLKEVTTIFINFTTAWPQVKQQGGNTALPINRKLD